MTKLFCILTLFITACTSSPTPAPSPAPAPAPTPGFGCSAETAITTGLASALASAANCTHPDVIQTDFQSALGKINLCSQVVPVSGKPALKGPVGDVVCPLAVGALIPLVTSKVLPATWGCDPSAKLADASALLSAACSKAIGI